MSNLVKRTISGLILAPIVIYIIYLGGLAYFGLVAFAFVGMIYEWCSMTSKSPKKYIWWAFGFVYIGFASFVMLVVSLPPFRKMFLGLENIPVLLFSLIFLVWINDIFAYIFGKTIGGPKLAVTISPNKTWAGAFGGVIGCLLFFFIMNYITNFKVSQINDRQFYIAFFICSIVPVISQIGDLFESWMKRKFGVKDSGNLIPGHGGLLDRLDGVLLVMNAVGIYFLVIFVQSYLLYGQG